MLPEGGITRHEHPLNFDESSNGQIKIAVRAQSIAQLKALLPSIAAKVGRSIDEVKREISKNGLTVMSSVPGPFTRPSSFGGPNALRSIVKSCLVLWSTRVGNHEALSHRYDAARDYVVNGSDSFSLERICVDGRDLPCAEGLKEFFGPLFNLIIVQSDSGGRVTGHFTAYNMISWRVRLCAGGAPPSCTVALVSNPLNVGDWSREAGDFLDIDDRWLNEPDAVLEADFENLNRRASAMSQVAIRRRTELAFKATGDYVTEALGLDDDTPLKGALLDRFVELFDGQVANVLCRDARVDELTPEEVFRMLSR